MSEPIYVSVDIETNGFLIGENSIYSIGSKAFLESEGLIGTHSVNLQEIEGGKENPDTMKFWAQNSRAFEITREDPQPIEPAMKSYVKWLKSLGPRLIFVAYPANFDFSFVNHYLLKYAGENPFGYCALDMKSFAASVLGTDFDETTEESMPDEWFPYTNPLPHVAINDAMAQGLTFMEMLAASKKIGRLP